MNMNLKIRPMAIDDAYEVARINTHSWQTAYKGILDQSFLDSLDIDKRASSWTDGIKNDSKLIRLVAETEGTIKGFVVGLNNRSHPNPDSDGELWAIYVDPIKVGNGIGTSLFRKFQNELQNRNMKSMCVWVLEENKQARAFYEKMGGNQTRDSKTFKVGNKEHLEVCYVFQLKDIL
jgi:ribosomal protein S18 acetylase RimI-like enzyme